MECVQFRISKNRLEYRALRVYEDEQQDSDGSCHTTLRIYYDKEYTEWEPVPSVPIKPVQPPGLTPDEIAELEAEESE